MKKQVWKGLALLMCCVVLLLACATVVLADGNGAKLANGGIMPVSTTGTVPVPSLTNGSPAGTWTGIVTDPDGHLHLPGNGTLEVLSLPTGLDHYDAVAELTLSDETVVKVGVVLYDPTYLKFIPIPNASMETVSSSGMPTGWVSSRTDEYTATATLCSTTEAARTGTASVKLVMTGAEKGFGARNTTKSVAIKEGRDYIGCIWVKTSSITKNGAEVYLTFHNANGSQTNYVRSSDGLGNGLISNASDWTKMEVRSQAQAGDKYATVLGYGFGSTKGTMYFDDALLFEVAWAGVLDDLNELLSNGASDDELYAKLTNPSLDIDLELNIARDADSKALYCKKLNDAYASGSALTRADIEAIAAEVKAYNQSLVETAIDKIDTTWTLKSLGLIAPPTVSDPLIETKWASVTGDDKGRISLLGGGASLLSRPDYGSTDEQVTMSLTVYKGNYSKTISIETTIPAYTQTELALMNTAKSLDINDYLGNDSALCVTDLPDLPPALDDIAVTWTASDSIDLSAGTITRPAYGEADALATLTATLTKDDESYTHDYRVIVAAKGAEEARTVLTKNVDFEMSASAQEGIAPAGWLKTRQWAKNAEGKNDLNTATTHTYVDQAFAYTGSQSLRLTANGDVASVQNEVVTTAREGYTYSLQVMAFAGDQADPAVLLKFLDNEGLVISSTSAAYADDSGAVGMWKNLTVSAVAPAGAVMVVAELDAGTVSGTQVWFDDVRLREWPLFEMSSMDDADWTLSEGWNGSASVSQGTLTLSSKYSWSSSTATATSHVIGATGGTYLMSVDATGGTMTLYFLDASGTQVGTATKSLASGTNTFFAYAPAETAGMQIKFSGTTTVSDVKILARSATGVGVADDDFEISANDGVGSPWTLSSATIASTTGKDSTAGVTVSSGTATSAPFPVEDGKEYFFAVDVNGTGTLTVNLYNVADAKKCSLTQSITSNDWTTLTIPCEALAACVTEKTASHPEHAYAQLVLSGDAVFDNARVYSVSTSVSNASMENTKVMPYGSFPYNWSAFGSGATYVANLEGQFHDGVKGLAIEPFGNETGIRSSYLKDIKANEEYEATIWAKGTNAKLNIEFWSADFTALSGGNSTTISGNNWKEYSVTGTAPANAEYVSLSVSSTGTEPVYVDDAAIVPVVRTIGTHVQLFLDDWLVDTTSGVERTFHSGSKQYVGDPFGAYSGSIQQDPYDNNLYKIWFRSGEALKYRTSKDLIDWDTTINPCVCIDSSGKEIETGGYVHIDTDPSVPVSERYKGIFFNGEDSAVDGAYSYYISSDGKNWTQVASAQSVSGYDVHTLAYDPVNKEYIMTYKVGHTRGLVEGQKRLHKVATSKDLMTWTEGVRMYTVGTPMDTIEQNVIRTDGYGNGMYALGDSYVSLNWRLLLDASDSFGGQLDSNLLFSRDLTEDWQRLEDEDGKAVLAIPRDNVVMGGVYERPADWHEHQIYTANEPIQVGNETWWHYYGHSYDHATNRVTPKETTVYSAYAVWRRNGFASMDFSAGGTMTTQPFTLKGEALRLNAKGQLTVNLLDESGTTVLATTEFEGDFVDQTQLWDKDVTEYLDQTVKLQFTSNSGNAHLYSIQMGELPKSYSIDATSVPHGSVSVNSTGLAGTPITITTTPETNYEVAELTVTGASGTVTVTETADGTYTFTMPAEAVTVTAKFWPEGSIWHEDFDSYAAGTKFNLDGTETLERGSNYGADTGSITHEIVNQGELTVAASGGGKPRSVVATNDSFRGSYIVETRIKVTPGSSRFTGLYLSNVKFPRAVVKNGVFTGYDTIKYDLRFHVNDVISIELNRALNAGANTGSTGIDSTNGNVLTGGADGALVSGTDYTATSRMYLYANGNPNNVVTDTAAVNYAVGEWYTVKIFVDATNKTVTTELWDGTGTTKLGSRTLFDAVIGEGTFEIESFYDSTAAIDYITVKEMECLHTNKEPIGTAVSATCTSSGMTAGEKCADCGETITAQASIPATGHTAGEAVKENEVKGSCTTAGSYESVVYCSVCGEELSRETIAVGDFDHTSADAVVENEVDATCTAEGSYESVVYCSVCGEELSRETIAVDKIAHSMVTIPAQAPTPESSGWNAYQQCSVCYYTEGYTELPATGSTPIIDIDFNGTNGAYSVGAEGDDFIYHTQKGAYTHTIDSNALKLVATNTAAVEDDPDTDVDETKAAETGRLRIQTATKITADKYTVSVRYKATSQFFFVRLPGVVIENTKSAGKKADYEFRAANGGHFVNINGMTEANTVHEVVGATEARLFDTGTTYGTTVVDMYNTANAGTEWFTVKIAVDKVAKTVTTTLYNEANDFLGYRTVNCLSINDATVDLEVQTDNATAYIDSVNVVTGAEIHENPTTLFYDNFESYAKSQQLPVGDTGNWYLNRLTGSGTYTVNADGNLELYAGPAGATYQTRVRTNRSFSGRYTIEIKAKTDAKYQTIIALLKAGTGAPLTAQYSDLRISVGTDRTRACTNNRVVDKTGTAFKEALSSSTWYTLRLHVLSDEGTVIHEIYDANDTTLMYTYTKTGLTLGNIMIDLANYSKNDVSDSQTTAQFDYVKVTPYEPTVTLTTGECENGSITLDKYTGKIGDLVGVEYQADPGYMLDTVKVNGDAISKSWFTLNDFHKNVTNVTATFKEITPFEQDFDSIEIPEGEPEVAVTPEDLGMQQSNTTTGGTPEFTVMKDGDNQYLKADLTTSRSNFKTKTVYAGDYVVENRIKLDSNTALSTIAIDVIRLDGVAVPTTGNANSTFASSPYKAINLSVRLKPTETGATVSRNGIEAFKDNNGNDLSIDYDKWYTYRATVKHSTNAVIVEVLDETNNVISTKTVEGIYAPFGAEAAIDMYLGAICYIDYLKVTPFVEEEEPVGVITGYGNTLLLEETIYINHYASITGFDGIDVTKKGGMLQWTSPIEEEDAVFGHEKATVIPNLNHFSGSYYTQASTGIVAKKYADEVYLRVYVEVDGEYVYGPLVTYSVQAYCRQALDPAMNSTDTLKKVCSEILYYGAAAQQEFNYNTTDLASDNVDNMLAEDEWNDSYLELPGELPAIDFDQDVTATWSMSLSLEDAVIMNPVVYKSGLPEGEVDLLVWYNANAESLSIGDATVYEMTDNGQYYKVALNGTPAKKYATPVFMCARITDGEGAETFTNVRAFNIHSYANSVFNNSTDEGLIEVCQRMLIYGAAAEAEFNKE